MANNESAGNGPKAFAGMIAIVAVITGIAAIVRPMQQSIDSLYDGQKIMASRLREDDGRERLDREELGRINERFSEVETQFDGLDERTQRIENSFRERIAALEKMLLLKAEITDKLVRDSFTILRGKIDEVADLNIKQQTVSASMWERMRALERKIYGQHINNETP